jgi:hypothetical protein
MRISHGNTLALCRILVLMMAAPGLSSADTHHSKNVKVRMKSYQNAALHVKLMIPEGWKVRPADKAIAFYSPYGTRDTRAALGIMKSSQPKLRIEKAAQDEFKAEGNPPEWQQTVTHIGHQRAIRVATRNKANPSMKRLDFYVQSRRGVYIIQCMALREKWAHYDPVFSSMISSLQFLP